MSSNENAPILPLSMRIAGICWCAFGGLCLSFSVRLITERGLSNGYCFIPFFLSLIPVFIGYLTWRGSNILLREMGIFSIFISCFFYLLIFIIFNSKENLDTHNFLALGVATGMGICLMFAGVLAFLGAAPHDVWRKQRKRYLEKSAINEDDRPES